MLYGANGNHESLIMFIDSVSGFCIYIMQSAEGAENKNKGKAHNKITKIWFHLKTVTSIIVTHKGENENDS